jgi:hypothetical protein
MEAFDDLLSMLLNYHDIQARQLAAGFDSCSPPFSPYMVCGRLASRYRVRWVLGIILSCIHFAISNSPVSLKGMLKYAFLLASMRICLCITISSYTNAPASVP